ncbi:DUF2264 domain-containing protein [Streptomyces sp. 110]|uniref:DUF2264 domain-containing protein n=1 Tax=Streptomyces endocoffeicus TaxID=2898945 RepID=A0ABS1Q679_9ACTN|nr:DUF2264 domain-containing protein [Streptomyces endocoffeicus]MBL1120181.1 DUF2264 domain-containing protein [Streptomyces endocoffeicus]
MSADTVPQAPGKDRALSPLTGWTRQHLVHLADRSLLALRPWSTPGHARFDLPGPPSERGPIAGGLEAFARSFLTVGFRLSAADSDPHNHAGWYAEGLAAGTDPASSERWPTLADSDQARVEAASIAIALHESRRWIWDNLSPRVQEQVVVWLAGSNGAWYPHSNWQWFHNVTHAFLRSVGGPHEQARVDEFLGYLDDCYLADGWYSDNRPDGRGGNIDWYAGWVMQQFSLWYCRMSAGEPGIAERQAVYAERLKAYLADAGELFGADGAPLYQGRSLSYRYAAVGALWTGAVFDASPYSAGRLRRTCMGAIKYFVERGAFDGDGLLSRGWHGRFDAMAESYASPGSPYWAGLGMTGLVLPESHPVWRDVEQPAPIDLEDRVGAIRPIGWLVSGTRSDGIVRVINHGVDYSTLEPVTERPPYNRFGYSTATAPVPLPDGSAGEAVDNQIALIDKRGRWSQRPLIDTFNADGNRAESSHQARFARAEPTEGFDTGPALTCISVMRGSVEVRAVQIESPTDAMAEALVISGYAVPGKPSPGARTDLVSAAVSLTAGGMTGRSVHAVETAFGSDLEVPWCRFDAPNIDRWYVVALSLGEHIPVWPTVDSGPNGRPIITWPGGELDCI